MNASIDVVGGVLFDLYSTLIHEAPRGRFYRHVPRALGVEADAWYARYRALGPATMTGALPDMAARVAQACADIGLARPPEAVRQVVDSAMPLFYGDLHVDEQAPEALARLRAAGYRLAVVSNASSYSEAVLERFDLRRYFDVVVLSYRLGHLKPDRRIYRVALAGLGLGAGRCAFVGDGGDDELFGARRVGLRTVLVDRALDHTDRARRHADAVCAGLWDAASVVLGPEWSHA